MYYFIFLSFSFFKQEKEKLDNNLLVKTYLYKKSFFHNDVKEITYYRPTFFFNNKVYNEKGFSIDFNGNEKTLIKVENFLEEAVKVFIDLEIINIHNQCKSFQKIKNDYFLIFYTNNRFISFWIPSQNIQENLFKIKEILNKNDNIHLKTIDLRNKKKIVVKF